MNDDGGFPARYYVRSNRLGFLRIQVSGGKPLGAPRKAHRLPSTAFLRLHTSVAQMNINKEWVRKLLPPSIRSGFGER
jgi:hypothetical protein